MDTRTLFAACVFLLTMRPATAVPSVPQAIQVSHSAAAATVQRFLTTRAARQYPQAYALLSTETQREMPGQQFQNGPTLPRNPSSDGMTPLLTAVVMLFLDTHNTGGYRYFVLGALPSEPDVVLVRARPPGAANVFLLKIVAAPDAVNDMLRLDLMKSLMRTDPHALEMARKSAEQMSSLSNLRQIGLGIIMYAQDNKNTLPDADRWVDEIMPYLKSEPLFHDPSAPEGQRWSYAFNKALSGKKISQIAAPASTVVVFESTLGTKNASDTGASVPLPGWHKGGTDYAFADGHARWIRDSDKPSFRLSGH